MADLTVAVPFFEDLHEAVEMIAVSTTRIADPESVEWLLVELEPGRNVGGRLDLPPSGRARLLPAASYRGLPAAKNEALRTASADMVLLLSPPLIPLPGSIELLVTALRSHPECCGICGQWRNALGEIERGYNVRSFPSLRALFYDLLFLNKVCPGNHSTRVYKMHDFDHLESRPVEHALDYALLVRKSALLDLGGFDEGYRFGWFDQVDICHAASEAGLTFRYEPRAVFESGRREPLLDRVLSEHYCDFYADQQRYVVRRFGTRAAREYRAILAAGMVIRLGFSTFLPRALRRRLLTSYRSYVTDGYIQSMKRAYRATLRSALFGL